MRFVDLAGVDVAVWGYGREGRSVLAALRRRFPDKPLTLYCRPGDITPQQSAELQYVDVSGEPPDTAQLSRHGVVVKSPGISAYRPEIIAARAAGTRFTSGTALWFGENPDARVAAVTGTKGKSTTTAMIAHVARALGVQTALGGNIGLPLLDLDGRSAALWVVELSSFQTGDAGPVEVGVITNLSEEHLDWHGSRERYFDDKLRLAAVAGTLVLGSAQPELLARSAAHPHRLQPRQGQGWHVRDGDLYRDGNLLERGWAALPPLRGSHNVRNACTALAALDVLYHFDGERAGVAARTLASFEPLPHRLTPLGTRAGVTWIDDSISTTPEATLAALESVGRLPATLILGGHDRGLDWAPFAAAIAARADLHCVAQGASGPRVADTLRGAGLSGIVEEVPDLAAAVARARALTPSGGVVLLSPGAPSFDQFRDYAERGRAFARLAGFDAAAIGEISGLGIA